MSNTNPTQVQASTTAESKLSARKPASSAFFARFQLEQPHWKAVLDRIEEKEMATLIIELFDRHPHLQAAHPAVYLRARHRVQEVLAQELKWANVAAMVNKLKHQVAKTCAHSFSAVKRAANARIRQHSALRDTSAKNTPATPELTWPTLIVQES